MKIPFPGPSQCEKGQKLMLVGKILDNNQVTNINKINIKSIYQLSNSLTF